MCREEYFKGGVEENGQQYQCYLETLSFAFIYMELCIPGIQNIMILFRYLNFIA